MALRAKMGDRKALERFVAVTRTDVLQLCRYLGQPWDPDDLAQETYLRALSSLHRFRGDGSARSWLLSIARRVCADATRRAVRDRALHQRLVSSRDSFFYRDSSWVEIHDQLKALSADRRDAFVLTQLLGLTYREAAEVVECPVGTIRSRVARARQQLLAEAEAAAAAEV